MQKHMHLAAVLLIGALALGPVTIPETVEADPEIETIVRRDADDDSEEDGWVKLANGKKKYRKNGEFLKGLQKIGDKQYYFNRYGVMAKSTWVRSNGKTYRVNSHGVVIKNKVITLDGKAYYVDETGAMYKGWKTFPKGKTYFSYTGIRAKGLTKIEGKYYYFTSSGYMATGTFTVNGVTYTMAEDGSMIKRKDENAGIYYDANNEPLSQAEVLNQETLDRARAIVAQITTPEMSQSDKLYTCFRWVISKPYATHRPFSEFEGWPATFANDHFLKGSGNCISDGAAFAYMAYVLGYDEVYMCTDSHVNDAHGWTEINGLAYDPLFAEAKSFSRNYAAPYGVYQLSPIVKVKMHG